VWQLKPLLDGKALIGDLNLPKASEEATKERRVRSVV
jgi:hypothetical protein